MFLCPFYRRKAKNVLSACWNACTKCNSFINFQFCSLKKMTFSISIVFLNAWLTCEAALNQLFICIPGSLCLFIDCARLNVPMLTDVYNVTAQVSGLLMSLCVVPHFPSLAVPLPAWYYPQIMILSYLLLHPRHQCKLWVSVIIVRHCFAFLPSD